MKEINGLLRISNYRPFLLKFKTSVILGKIQTKHDRIRFINIDFRNLNKISEILVYRNPIHQFVHGARKLGAISWTITAKFSLKPERIHVDLSKKIPVLLKTTDISRKEKHFTAASGVIANIKG